MYLQVYQRSDLINHSASMITDRCRRASSKAGLRGHDRRAKVARENVRPRTGSMYGIRMHNTLRANDTDDPQAPRSSPHLLANLTNGGDPGCRSSAIGLQGHPTLRCGR